MYQLGQKIVYGSHGVCNIVDLEDKKVDGKMICYFVLEPADHPGTRYYLPAANPAENMRFITPISFGKINTLRI